MSEKVLKLGLVKPKKRVFIKSCGSTGYNVICYADAGTTRELARVKFDREPNYFYFIDRDGDVSRSKRGVKSAAPKSKAAPAKQSKVKSAAVPKKASRVTEVAFCFDRSESMSSIKTAAKRMFNTVISSVRDAEKSGHAVRVSIYWFGVGVQRGVSCVRASEVSDIAFYNPSDSGTALWDGVGDALTDMQKRYNASSDTSFVLNVVTDGHENSSRRFSAGQIVQMMRELQGTDKFTMTFMVPHGNKKQLCSNFKIPTGNVIEWEQSSEGADEAASQTRSGFNSYFAARSAGQTSTRAFYKTDASKITVADLSKMQVLNAQVVTMTAKKEEKLREFCERVTKQPLLRGAAFYQLMKTEKNVQGYKKLLIRDKATSNIYGGDEARKLLGLPLNEDVSVAPGNHANFDVFIQSTSVNRLIPRGTDVAYWAAAGEPYTEGKSAR